MSNQVITMTTILRHPVFYANFTLSNIGTYPSIDAIIDQTYATPLVPKADDYVMAVERFEIPLNAVPFYDGNTLQEAVSVDRRNLSLPTAAVLFTTDTFSMMDLIRQLNLFFADTTAGQPGDVFRGVHTIAIDAEGFTRITFPAVDAVSGLAWNDENVLDFTGAPVLASILGIDLTRQLEGPPRLIGVASTHPRWDLGDQLSLIRVGSNLPVVTDSFGDARTNVLTDVSIPFQFSVASGRGIDDGFTETEKTPNYSPRQRLIYVPVERRFLNVRSSQPITDVRITMDRVRPDGRVTRIKLPVGGVFNIKIGFWSKTGDPEPSREGNRISGAQRGMVVF